MSRNLIVTIIVILVIVGAGGYYFMNRTAVAPANPETQTPSASPTAAMEKTSLKNFMTMQGTQKCDFNDTETGSSGTVYIASGKFRGDFSSNVDGKVTPSHMINDGKDVYIWMDDQQTGFKTSLEAIEQVNGTTGSTQAVDINKEVDYKCEEWSIDPVKFVVPVEIKFNDMSQMMESAAKMMQSASPNASAANDGNAAACAACNNLEGDSQTQCKRALKCN